jgi:hypothetical protein
MKTKPIVQVAAGLLLATIFTHPSILRAQGSLTPPGAPAPTMKSLDQIEPRTPISSAPFTISQPGSYYLTTNLVAVSGDSGIFIQANNVTLDLNGFSMLGNASAFFAIIINDDANITVRNGTISDWSVEPGIYNIGRHVVLEHLNLSGNWQGLNCANDTVIRDCVVSDSGVDGIVLGNNSTVTGCLVQSNAFNGISVQGNGNIISGNNFCGNNTSSSFGVSAINVTGSYNRVEDNHVTGTGSQGFGISVTNFAPKATNNIIIKNSVVASGLNNYNIAPLNDAGPIGAAATNTSPWGNFSH